MLFAGKESYCGVMDLAHALWQLVAATIILLLVHWYMKRKQLFNYFKDLGIPGPEPSIITGNMNELRQKLLFQSKRPPSPHNKSLIQLTGKRWKEVRSVLTPSFTTNKLKMMAPGMICTVREFMDKITEYARSGEEFEIGDLFQAMTMDVICRSAMGIEYSIQKNPNHSLLTSCKLLFNGTFSWISVLLGEHDLEGRPSTELPNKKEMDVLCILAIAKDC
ncbi:hypothetical protein MTO96_021892 [Rhipicephalus appendiculatus]